MAPDSYQADVECAARLLEEGRLDEARDACRALIDSPAHDGRALLIAGIVAMKQGETKQALDLLMEAARERPSDPAVHNTLGELLRTAGELEQAEGHLRYALHLDRTLAAAHFNLGLLLWHKGDSANAALCLRNVLAIDPSNAEALRRLARLCMDDGDAASAVSHLEQAVALDPQHGGTHAALGEAFWALGDTRAARDRYGAAASIEPENGVMQFQAACASFELCRVEEALAHLRCALDSPSSPLHIVDPLVRAGRLANIRTSIDESDIVRVGRGQWHKLSGGPRVLSADPAHTPPELFQPFSNEMFTARLSGAQVLPGELVPMAPDGALFIEHVLSKHFQRAHTCRCIMHTSDDGRLLLAFPQPVREEEECVLLGAAPTHIDWLFECLARLWIVKQRPALEDLPLIVQAGLAQWQQDLLGLMGYGSDRLIEAGNDTTLCCRELHVPSLPGVGHFVAPAAIEHLRRELRKAVHSTGTGPSRIYLSRRGASSRGLANESELEPLLRQHGFEILHPESYGAAELLSAMQLANVILGVEGAAMAHLFFAPPRARIGMIVAEGLQSTRYYGPSAVLGQDFTFLLAKANFSSHPDHGECDLVLERSVLERFLSQLQ